MKIVTFDPRHDSEKKIMIVAVLLDGAWAAEIHHDDHRNQSGDAVHVWLANGDVAYGGNRHAPKNLWECRRWCEESAAKNALSAAARPMNQDEKDDSILGS